MLSMLRGGMIKALVLDNTFIDYQDAINCDLHSGEHHTASVCCSQLGR